jgi:hypothetical protein
VLAIKAVGAGTVKLTAQAGSRKATCTVTIYSHVTGVSLSSTNYWLYPRGRAYLSARLEIDGMAMPIKPIAPTKPNPYSWDYPQQMETYPTRLAQYKADLAQYNADIQKFNALKKMATNTTVYYSSSNTAVATVNSSGTVTPKDIGNATITATTAEGNYTARCAVTVGW